MDRTRKRKPIPKHPQIKTASGRSLACYPAAVLAFIVDSYERCLLLRKPGQHGWEVVSGALEPGETVTEGVLREVLEEAGLQVVHSLGVIDTFTFVFDANQPPLISICCLIRYRGGEIRPGGDAKDAEFKWWDLREIDEIDLIVPKGRWDLLTRAVDMSRFLRDAAEPEEEKPLF